MLYNAPRSASIKSIGKCELWGIDRETFKKVIQELAVIEFQENRKYLDKIDFFSQFNEDQKDKIAGVLSLQKFKKGDDIINRGDTSNSFYIIKDGSVDVINKKGDWIRTLTAGQTFGEAALLVDEE